MAKIRLTESDLRNIIKESVKRVLRESSVYPGYDTTTTNDMSPINNKNYEYDPVTRSGTDKTMGKRQNFKFNGDDPEDFANLLRKSDGDDFNPDWMESYGGVDFEGESTFDEDAWLSEITEKLTNAGVKDVTDVGREFREKDGTEDEYYFEDLMTFGSVKPYLSESGMEHLQREGYIYNWFIEVGGKTFCSRHNFTDEDVAQRNCDKYIKMIGEDNIGEARVDSIFEDEKYPGYYGMDTMLINDEGFWMD